MYVDKFLWLTVPITDDLHYYWWLGNNLVNLDYFHIGKYGMFVLTLYTCNKGNLECFMNASECIMTWVRSSMKDICMQVSTICMVFGLKEDSCDYYWLLGNMTVPQHLGRANR